MQPPTHKYYRDKVHRPNPLVLTLVTRTTCPITHTETWSCNVCNNYKGSWSTSPACHIQAQRYHEVLAYQHVMRHATECYYNQKPLDRDHDQHIPSLEQQAANIKQAAMQRREKTARWNLKILKRKYTCIALGDLHSSRLSLSYSPSGFVRCLFSPVATHNGSFVWEGYSWSKKVTAWEGWVMHRTETAICFFFVYDGKKEGLSYQFQRSDTTPPDKQWTVQRVNMVAGSRQGTGVSIRPHRINPAVGRKPWLYSIAHFTYDKDHQLTGPLDQYLIDVQTGQTLYSHPTYLGAAFSAMLQGFGDSREYDHQGKLVQRYVGELQLGITQGLGACCYCYFQTDLLCEGWWFNNRRQGLCFITDRDCQCSMLGMFDAGQLFYQLVHNQHPAIVYDSMNISTPQPDLKVIELITVVNEPEAAAALFNPHTLALPKDFVWMDVAGALQTCTEQHWCSTVAGGNSFITARFSHCVTCSLHMGCDMLVCEACRQKCHKNCELKEAREFPSAFCDCPFLHADDGYNHHCQCQPKPPNSMFHSLHTLYQLRLTLQPPLPWPPKPASVRLQEPKIDLVDEHEKHKKEECVPSNKETVET